MAESLDLSGKRFDFLIVVGLHHIEKKYDINRNRYANKRFWLCRCECGNKIIRTTSCLTNKKHVHSCGCQLSYKARVKSSNKKQKYPKYKQIITRWSKIKERLYNPNSRWVDRKTQNRNTRRNVFINYNGEIHCMSEWAEICGTSLKTFWQFANNHNKDYGATIEHFKKIY